MKPFSVSLMVFLLLLYNTGYGQGGANCTAAMAHPITLPFNGSNQTTCGSGDEIKMIKGPCSLTHLFIGAEDYLYYFVADRTGIVTFNLKILNNNGITPIISVTEGCVGSSEITTCILAMGHPLYVDDGTRNASFPVVQGKGYTIIIDQEMLSIQPSCFSFNIDIKLDPDPPINPSCSNADFERGNISGWTARYGASKTAQPGAKTPEFALWGIGAQRNRHEIQTGGLDPYGNFPRVSPGGKYSLKLGNDGPFEMRQAEQLRQTFIVDPNNPTFTYKYAVVFDVPKHNPEDQPFFKVQMLDKNGKSIPCSEYIVAASTKIPGFQKAQWWQDVYFKAWTSVAVNLRDYINQPVTLEITVGDCSQGGHFGYAYIDGTCFSSTNLGSTDTICLGDSKKLMAPDGYAAYLWQPGGQTTREIDATANGVYTVKMTSYTGCMVNVDDTLVVSPAPKADFTFNSSNCIDGMVFSNLANVANGRTAFKLKWDFGPDATPRISTDSVVKVQFKTPGDHQVSLKASSNSGCADSISKKVSVSPCIFSVRLDGGSICSNGCVTLKPQIYMGTPPYTYNWSPNIGTGAGPYTVCPKADSTQYILTVTDATGLTDTASAWIVKSKGFSLTASSTDIGCNGKNDGRANVTVQGGVAPFVYQWSNGVKGPTDSLLGPGIYTVVVTDALGCIDSAQVTVSGKARQLEVKIDTDSADICYGSMIKLTATGATNYTWSPAQGLNNTVGNVVDAKPNASTVYRVIGTDATGCTDTSYAKISISAPMQAVFSTTKATCLASDGSIITTIKGGKQPFDYLWNNGETTKDLTGLKVGNYILTTTDQAGCNRKDTVLLTNINKGFPVNIQSGKSAICIGDSVSLFSNTAGVRRWYSDGISLGAVGNLRIKPEQSANYMLLVTDSIGCVDSSSIQLTVHPLPRISLGISRSEICLNEPITLSANGALEYYWSANTGNSKENNLTLYPTISETYTVYGKDSKGCTSDTAAVQVTVHPLPGIDISADTMVERGQQILLHPAYPHNTTKWKWQPESNISCIDCPTPTITVLQPSRYYLTITDEYGCSAIDSIQVLLTCSGNFIQFPNAFSPNGDGNNDFFKPFIGAGLMIKAFSVFNRWGELLYNVKNQDNRSNPLQGWDGKFKGVMQSQGSYVFIMEVECPSGEHNYYKGVFLLVQ